MLVILLLATLIEVTFSSTGERNEVYKVGCNTFDKVVKSAAYVDKSLLIKEFFNREFILITAPRRFGKSINMDMIKTFCEVTVDNNGNRVAKNGSKNYNIFSENNLRIFQDRVFFYKNFGNYPTIFLDFKRLSCSNYQAFIHSFRRIINTAYKSHKYLLNSVKLDEVEKNMFKMFYDYAIIKDVIDEDLKDSITTLTDLLYSHFNTESIILIDELDGPIQKAINKAGSEVSEIFDFIMEFISATLKTNKFVERSLINACVRLSGLLTTEANNIIPIPFLSNPNFTQFYGLLESEVQDLLGRFSMSEKINDVRYWYDGYRELGTNVKIYNVFAIVRYLESRKLESYWAESGGVKNFKELLTYDVIRNKIELLLDDFESTRKGTEILYKNVIDVNEILRLKKILDGDTEITDDDSDLFFQYLTENGYFNVLSKERDEATIQIPNMEIKEEINHRINSNYIKFYQGKFKDYYKEFIELPCLFNNITKNNHLKYMKRIANSTQNLYCGREEIPCTESQLQRDLVLSFKKSKLFAKVRAEKNAGEGRLDIFLETKNLNAFIIELKVAPKTTSYGALKQILNKHYYDILDDNYKMQVFLGLHLSKEGNCTISYLIDSRDINDAYNVTDTFINNTVNTS